MSNSGPVLPAFAYGMNLQLVRGQPQTPTQPFRILTTCSWEQNAYTVKIYVPLHGVKTDLLRAVFQPHTMDIKAINLQVGANSWSELAIGFVSCCSLSFCDAQHQMLLPAAGSLLATTCLYALCVKSHLPVMRRGKITYLALSRHSGLSTLMGVQSLPVKPRKTF